MYKAYTETALVYFQTKLSLRMTKPPKKGDGYWQPVVSSKIAIDNQLSKAIDNQYSLAV